MLECYSVKAVNAAGMQPLNAGNVGALLKLERLQDGTSGGLSSRGMGLNRWF